MVGGTITMKYFRDKGGVMQLNGELNVNRQ